VANKSTQSDSLLVYRYVTRTVGKHTLAGSLRNKRILENKLQQNNMNTSNKTRYAKFSNPPNALNI